MFNRDEINRAVHLQDKSYRLLRWFSASVGKGTIKFQNAHDTLSASRVARDWIEHFIKSLPPDVRPEPHELDDFANLFSSYLTSSFELAENPGTRLMSGHDWCCEMCSYIVQASNLKTKSLTSGNKQKAMRLKVACLERLALEVGCKLSEPEAERLVKALAEDAALVTYASQLITRMHGQPGTPASLALWREFAWDKTGAPKRKFKLEAEMILRAEQRLTAAFRGDSA